MFHIKSRCTVPNLLQTILSRFFLSFCSILFLIAGDGSYPGSYTSILQFPAPPHHVNLQTASTVATEINHPSISGDCSTQNYSSTCCTTGFESLCNVTNL